MENESHDDRLREARRRDDTMTRLSPSGLRVESPLSSDQERLVRRVMDAAFTVHRALGPGFREKIYQRALCLELDSQGLKFECERPIDVRFKDWRIPGQKIDLLVEQFVLVEAKVVPRIRPIHRAQITSYLKTLDLRIGLLINFNVAALKDGFKRVVR
jgi:GxxExxY protein